MPDKFSLAVITCLKSPNLGVKVRTLLTLPVALAASESVHYDYWYWQGYNQINKN